jgi:hypothetical protein
MGLLTLIAFGLPVIRQMDGLELATDKLGLAAPDLDDLTLSDFHEISRAAEPKDFPPKLPRTWSPDQIHVASSLSRVQVMAPL